ncbi:MAG: SDR family oxidoreductase [Nocardioides sp.]|uniref:SDR family oxidoreductase n=1 Tax=Nocardioides sp. TaxID=35761 RepID=UPI0039E5B6A0
MTTTVTVGIATGAGRGMGLECGRELLALVDHVILVDRDAGTVERAAAALQQEAPESVVVEPFVLDITDRDGLDRLAAHVGETGTLRAVAHAAGISPTMADWRRIFEVDLIGSALLIEALRPLSSDQTAFVCFSSMSPLLLPPREDDAALDALMARPLAPDFLERLEELAGAAIENTGWAYGLAKRGVKVLVQQEAVALGAAGARICSIAPGVIATPQGKQEAEAHPSMLRMVEQTPLGRMGEAHEVAAVAGFALSDAASFLNGVDLLVDGGVFAALQVARR